MRFVNPQWLWGLLLLPALFFALGWDFKRRTKRMTQFANPALWKAIAPELELRASLRKGRLLLVAFGFILLALARPQWGTHEEVVQVSGLDIIVALDVSNSMEVEDVVPSRLKKAKHLIRTLLERLKGDRVGVVAFAGSSYVASPLTTDLEYISDTVDVLGPKSVTNQGTDIGIALETAARALDRGAEESPQQDQATEQRASRVVILISDGEDHEAQAVEGAQTLAKTGARLYVLGVGTQKGGPIPTRDETGQLHGYKRTRSGEGVVSAFNPAALTQLAAAAKGRYWNVTTSEAEVDELLQDLGALERGDFVERRNVVHEDRFQFPLAIAVVLLFIELCLPAKKILPKTKSGRALVSLLVLGFSVWASPAQADLVDSVGSYLENEKGIKNFSEGKVDEAKRNFGTAQALAPDLPELQFNQGSVQAQGGDVEAAIQSYGAAAQGALAASKPALAGKAFFNLASVLSKKGEFQGALQSYLKAIDAAVVGKDPGLEADARKNVQLLLQEKKKQQQKQQKDQQKKDQEKKEQEKQEQEKKDQQKEQGQSQDKNDEQDKKGQSEKKEDQNKGQGQDQDKKDQDKKDQEKQDQQQRDEQKYSDNSANRKREFRSLKMSKEDADRVMAELSNRERELQAKKRKQRGHPQTAEKDW